MPLDRFAATTRMVPETGPPVLDDDEELDELLEDEDEALLNEALLDEASFDEAPPVPWLPPPPPAPPWELDPPEVDPLEGGGM